MKPPVSELEFLKLVKNHAKTVRELHLLGLSSDLPKLKSYAEHVASSWLRLGCRHLADAEAALSSGLERSVYSRSYYAAYNASKAVRYLVTGAVSLEGDDHRKVSDLPDDFPDVARWASELVGLYEHRLRADYDNWQSTPTENVLTLEQAFQAAREFVGQARTYLEEKCELKV